MAPAGTAVVHSAKIGPSRVTAALPTARIGQHVEDVGKVQQAVGIAVDGAHIVGEVAGNSGDQQGSRPRNVIELICEHSG
ncbi:hypothetical protein [Streptomyces sanyensis]|uniref:hypothetical protein n=1 Tax=Streptomyces sanyensis TaxID=568869 RepID=UPI0031EA1E7B